MIKKFLLSILIDAIKNNNLVHQHVKAIVKPLIDEYTRQSAQATKTVVRPLIDECAKQSVQTIKVEVAAVKVECVDIINDLDERFNNLLDAINVSLTNSILQSKRLKEQQQRLRVLEKLIAQQLQNTKLNGATSGNTVSQFKELDEKIKKARADAAVVIKIVKDDVSDLEIRLDAFIDTISEKIAELTR